jgi:DNA-binding transcriptional ArsR family regulator
MSGGFVFHSAERLAEELEVNKRTIERQLRQLREAGLLKMGRDELGRAGFLMLVLPPKGSAISDNSVGAERQNDRRSPIVLAEIADRSGGDRRSFCHPLKEEQDVKQDVKQEREQDLTQARALAAASSVPDGAPPLGKTRPALRNLVELLADGEDPELIERVLRRAADIVARGFEAPAYFGGEMFVGRVWSHWCRSLFELERVESAEAAAAARLTEVAEAEAAAAARQAQAAAIEADRIEVRVLFDRVRRAQARTCPDAHTALLAEHDAFEAALAYAPAAALAALQHAQDLHGEALTGAMVRAVVVDLGIKPPARRTLTPADLRAARERAQAEGRDPLEVFEEMAQ